MTENPLQIGQQDNGQINRDKIRDFYDQQVLANSDMPAILGVTSMLAADLRDFEEWRAFRKLVQLHPDMRILELGCGGGRWCEHFSNLVKSAVGIDLSKNAIDYAKRKANKKSLKNIEYYNASLEDYQPSGIYDLIYFSSVALYMDDSGFHENLNKYTKYLQKDGMVVIRDSLTNKTHTICHPQGYSARYRTRDDFDAFFHELGFELAAHERAFPPYCLSGVFSKRVLSFFYKASPSVIRHFIIKTFLGCCKTDRTKPHWNNGDLIYNHDFLVYIKRR